MGRVLQRRALLVSPTGPISAALRRGGKALRIAPGGRGSGAQVGQLRPRLPRIGFVLPRGAPPVALPEPGRAASRHHANDRHRDDDDEQRQRDAGRWIAGVERIERHRHQMTIGDREDDKDQAQRNQHQRREEFSHDHLSRYWRQYQLYAPASGAPPSRFRRSRISLPVLKNGTLFWSTGTCAPVRGLRPARAGRCFTEKAPKPRSSTRSPRAKAATISSRIAFTMFSTSRW